MVSLADCCSAAISYGIVQPGPHVSDGIAFVNVEDMTAGALRPDQLPRTSVEISRRHSRTVLSAGDVLVALRGPIGLTAVVDSALSGANLSRGVARLALLPTVEPSFVRACFQTSLVRRQILRMQTGSTFKELKIGALRQIRIPLPDMGIQRELVERVDRALAVSVQCDGSVAALRSLRSAALREALDGFSS